MPPTSPSLTPFSCTVAPNFAELLWSLKTSIAITTYQAGKLVLISPLDENKVIQLPRSFRGAMGVHHHDDKLVLGTSNEVIVFRNSPDHARTYQGKENVYDSMFLPRMVYKTGFVDMHDLHLAENGTIFGVNTLFSCVAEVTGEASFQPLWKPDFITELAPEDRCHLNGLIVLENKPSYCTALGRSNTPRGWKANIDEGGLLMDIQGDSVLMEGLAMPHSPVWHNEKIYFLQSASGELTEFDPQTGTSETIYKADKFVRGLSIHGDFAFIGLSRIRPNASSFRNLKIMENSKRAGLLVVHLPTRSLFSWLSYNASVDEIYDVSLLPNTIRPNILDTESEKHHFAISFEGHSYWTHKKSPTGQN